MTQRYAFGGFVLEQAQQRLLDSQGAPVALTPRLFSALVLFVERAGELIDKDSMMAALWPGLVVEENNLNQVVAGLRRALGDEAQKSRFIQTVPRRGFRFVAPVTPAPERAEAKPGAARPEPRPSARELAMPDRRLYLAGALGMAAGCAASWALRLPPAIPAGVRATLAVCPSSH